MLVIGTRPEAIKLAPVARALAAVGLPPKLVFTGQHAALAAAEHGLSAHVAEHLGCPGRADPDAHVADVRAAMARWLGRHPAGLVVVQGDTSSALGGALGAADLGIAVAHVEAGLRTGDLAMPWPEEGYRIAIDRIAALLFAPTQLSADNLRRESVQGVIEVTGNTGIDALMEVMRVSPPPFREHAQPHVLVTCHRRESWGDGLRAVSAAVRTLADNGVARFELLLHPNLHVAGQMRAELGGCKGVELVAPCSHAELVQRMRSATLVLSDSGGMQEEAPVLGIPMLVLRDKTERPEGIASGNALLVGTGTAAIVREVERLLDDRPALARMSRRAHPYGDGHAAPRIAAAITRWIEDSAAPKTMRGAWKW